MKMWLRRSKDGQFYADLMGDNYETVAVTETYPAKASARKAAELIRREAASATIYDMTEVKV